MVDLFAASAEPLKAARPLADRLRPQKISEVIGQEHLTGAEGALTRLLKSDNPGSMIFWGPPGSGKTTMARLLARETTLAFEPLSAIFSGVADLKKAFDLARARRMDGRATLLFVDEIHRFNRAQQDAFLPVMEDGTITLVGATTENPSFALNGALLSRARVLTFKALDDAALEQLLQRAEALEARKTPLDEGARLALLALADGDGRALLTLLETLWRSTGRDDRLNQQQLLGIVQRRAPIYDKSEDSHYNLISALHKSVRGSDPDAALYYFSRMLEGGEDPRYLARRLVRMAFEDIGLADPQALLHARAAAETYEQLGSPEGELALANSVVYLALAPKSNAVYVAYKAARNLVKQTGSLAPPKHILNAPTKFMAEEGYGAGYAYDHDAPDAFSGQDYFPEKLGRQEFYQPTARGHEQALRDRMAELKRLRRERRG